MFCILPADERRNEHMTPASTSKQLQEQSIARKPKQPYDMGRCFGSAPDLERPPFSGGCSLSAAQGTEASEQPVRTSLVGCRGLPGRSFELAQGGH